MFKINLENEEILQGNLVVSNDYARDIKDFNCSSLEIDSSIYTILIPYKNQFMEGVYQGACANFKRGFGSDLGDWKNVSFIKNIKPCLVVNGQVKYYLDPNNHLLSIDGRVVSDSEGDFMVEFPKVYMKFESKSPTTPISATESTLGGYLKVSFSQVKHDDTWIADAFIDDNGNEKDKLYIAMYLSSLDYDNAWLVSNPNINPIYSSRGVQGEQLYLDAKNELSPDGGLKCSHISYSQYLYIQMLYMLVYGTLSVSHHMSSWVGVDCSNILTGGTLTDGIFSSRDNYNKIFYMENFSGYCTTYLHGMSLRRSSDSYAHCSHYVQYLPPYQLNTFNNSLLVTNTKLPTTDITAVGTTTTSTTVYPFAQYNIQNNRIYPVYNINAKGYNYSLSEGYTYDSIWRDCPIIYIFNYKGYSASNYMDDDIACGFGCSSKLFTHTYLCNNNYWSIYLTTNYMCKKNLSMPNFAYRLTYI